jgi:hypothetical protein
MNMMIEERITVFSTAKMENILFLWLSVQLRIEAGALYWTAL